MEINRTNIEGLYVLKYKKYDDLRGELRKPYCFDEFQNNTINANIFKEVWFTSSKLDVIRGMHYQSGEKACEKLVSCIKGKVLDVILDLRNDSATYGEYFSIKLSDDDPTALYIPIDCAHGYKVLKEDSIMMYMATEIHSPPHDIGVKWDSFGFNWGIKQPILSNKDKSLPEFKR
ncbi:dTDP-4-dehydrorhamnose 3,5-epimerase family protein [Alkalihalobacillus deserti]|uniref:dTDP-4-dehydrorhamnose 3,5-epimerase family protein n=1 Tax=Alkalihalobacillus deserti TaxID=2879466 RepID=UPI001D1347DF|nr:dTDP-4-dehydrorhamnose 3,5-epimerase family protein [Alkalihalobacillus deserti]